MSVVDGTYCNSADVTNLTGYFHKTMLTFGREMTEGEYEMFVSGLVRTATELVNRWCNVSTFYSHEITDEYHTMNIDDLYMYSDYILRPYGFGYSPYSIDMEVKRKQFYPREYPVISVSKGSCQSCFCVCRPTMDGTRSENNVCRWRLSRSRTGSIRPESRFLRTSPLPERTT